MLEPANTIITICGGYDAVAGIVGRSGVQVRRWTYPRERGGTGGLIPSECATILMRHARQAGLPLTPAHFFPPATADGDAA